MGLNQDDVIEILKIMKESSFDELHLKMGDLELTVNKNGSHVQLDPPTLVSTENTGSLSANEATIADPPEFSKPAQFEEIEAKKRQIESEMEALGLIAIKSPMLGIFFRAPKPGEPPFVETDSVVDENTTVCTIEVMKLFSTIKAGTSGRIKRICAENGELVEHGQVLFLVERNGG